MPWVDRGVVTCNIGVNTTLISVPRADFRVAVQRSGITGIQVEYIGILRWCQGLPGITPSVDAEIASRPFWYSTTQWRLGNNAAEGRVVFYNPESSTIARMLRVWEFVP